jgi:hypothetical protein
LNIALSGVLASFLAASSARSAVLGSWAYIEKWYSGPRAVKPTLLTSRALLVEFCPEGEFVLTRGVLYREGDVATVGPDDDLQVFRGTWVERAGGASVVYRLHDYELLSKGAARALNEDIHAEVALEGTRLSVPILQDDPAEGVRQVTFEQAKALRFRLENRFGDCRAPGPKAS